ncbi:unnamed protein product [Musa banksii]
MGGRGEFMRMGNALHHHDHPPQLGYAGTNILSFEGVARRWDGPIRSCRIQSLAYHSMAVLSCCSIVTLPVMDKIFYYTGLKHVSPTFSSAMSIDELLTRAVVYVGWYQTPMDLNKVIYRAKVVGTLVTVAGPMLMAIGYLL